MKYILIVFHHVNTINKNFIMKQRENNKFQIFSDEESQTKDNDKRKFDELEKNPVKEGSAT